MLKNALSDSVNWQTRKWSNSTKSQALAWMIINLSRKNSKQSGSQIVLKCLYLARIGRPDILWSVNKPFEISHKMDSGMFQTIDKNCHVGNTVQHCRLGLFQDSDFAGDLEDSESTSGRCLVYLWK